ncbi:MAG: substrate-binding domain-containing protein [Devosia sp.]
MKGIRRLAKELDISIGTVSRALNGHRYVKDATRKRVLEAAKELGYVPNQSGRALRKGTTGVVGFMIETGVKTAIDGETFFLAVFDGVQAVLARRQLDLVALLCSSEEDPYEYLRRMVGRGFVDGLIISATQRYDPRIDLLADQHIPFITLGRSLTDRDHAWYDLDFEALASVSVHRLVKKGHRRIALAVQTDQINFSYVLLASYQAALEAHGIAFDPTLVLSVLPGQADGHAVVREILEMRDRPTAIILGHEAMSVGFYRGLAEAGVRPGRDIAIIGRASPHMQLLSPSLTSFATSLRDLGAALAEALLLTMPDAPKSPNGPVRELWPFELHEGESDALTLKQMQKQMGALRLTR